MPNSQFVDLEVCNVGTCLISKDAVKFKTPKGWEPWDDAVKVFPDVQAWAATEQQFISQSVSDPTEREMYLARFSEAKDV